MMKTLDFFPLVLTCSGQVVINQVLVDFRGDPQIFFPNKMEKEIQIFDW